MASFKDAFRSARKSGKKEFSWDGKRYNTKLREDSAPVPTARPERKADTATSGASRSTANKVKPKETKQRERADYPRPSKQTGVARAGSRIADSAAKRENAPVAKEKQGPVNARAVGIARKGSAISRAVARKENEPKRKSNGR